MAHEHTGAVTISAAGKSYTLRFSVNAICELEKQAKMTFPEIATQMADPMRVSMTLVRHLLHAGLSDHHPDITLRQAGELVPALGGVYAALEPIGKALGLAFPDSAGRQNPPDQPGQQQGGTGSAS